MTVKLGNNPKSFKKEIVVVSIDGKTDTVTFDLTYRNPEQFAALMDARAAAEADMQIPPDRKNVDIVRDGAKRQALNVLALATGWDLVDEFSVDNLIQLEYDFPGTLLAVQSVYQSAVLEARVKN